MQKAASLSAVFATSVACGDTINDGLHCCSLLAAMQQSFTLTAAVKTLSGVCHAVLL